MSMTLYHADTSMYGGRSRTYRPGMVVDVGGRTVDEGAGWDWELYWSVVLSDWDPIPVHTHAVYQTGVVNSQSNYRPLTWASSDTNYQIKLCSWYLYEMKK